ncbi:MAG: molybdenum-dependent transcriptional regulator [Methylomonas sp.]|nr:MAG: molybdenum-dependent transcriptional regulator [Methylomonas sp.]PPD25183.1 MAG: molybdenum-dependent transcriptional regulator [Methylomonas sp.]PPD34814.1 MAG: molybdenum-dependent transcriptional regulator [Methylomonas sp.]PPD41190.1 MAG: molybdenum-dependent transcriptional regulator [Methylomonas sp.]PPD54744.1 MAG: molybdenum-dependent transcriptional regulator [Methylomonas sp.]
MPSGTPTRALNQIAPSSNQWVTGELALAGALDRRMIGLLMAIEQTGSINQAAKQAGLSYKGAWQIIERANNSAPKALVNTVTGGSKGGGTALTKAGLALVALFKQLEQEHQVFLAQLNQRLADDPDTLMLLQHLAVKTSAHNQLFGHISALQIGAANAELSITLAADEQVIATIELSMLRQMNLQIEDPVLLLINDADVMLAIDHEQPLSARNRLACRIIRIHHATINSEVTVSLASGQLLVILLTRQSAEQLQLAEDMQAWAVFKSNAPILGVPA